MTSFDAIIIGGGHNGLVTAIRLAKAGKRVLVLEAGAAVGGGAATVEFHPGFRASALAHLVNRLDDGVVAACGLNRSVFEGEPLDTVLLSETAPPVILRGDWGETIDGVAEDQAKAFRALRDKLVFQAGLLGRFLDAAPPALEKPDLATLFKLGGTGLKLLSKGRYEAREALRMLLMNIYDVADEALDDPRLKGFLAFEATLGIHLGPRSPTSLMGLYYRLTGAPDGRIGRHYAPKGGMGALTAELVRAAENEGVKIRSHAPVEAILTDGETAQGVVLQSGEILRSSLVVAAIHPGTALLDLLPAGTLGTGLERDMGRIRSKGDTARLTLALNKVPSISGLAASDHRHRLIIAPDAETVERAFNPAKYGELPDAPVMEILIPSLTDTSLAPSSQAVLTALIQHVPHDLKEGWESGRPKLLKTILEMLERHAPGITESVVNADLMAPPDIAARFNMPGGHWHHGELQVDQMFFNRPVHAVSRHATPVKGLYLASAGTHPGGGISGRPGLNAANAILKGVTA